jgi:hypothetical protein
VANSISYLAHAELAKPRHLKITLFTKLGLLSHKSCTHDNVLRFKSSRHASPPFIFGLAYQGKDIVFEFITEYSRLTDFGP